MSHLSMDTLVALREPGTEPGEAAAREHLERLPALPGRARAAAPAGGPAEGAAGPAPCPGPLAGRSWAGSVPTGGGGGFGSAGWPGSRLPPRWRWRWE